MRVKELNECKMKQDQRKPVDLCVFVSWRFHANDCGKEKNATKIAFINKFY